MDILRRDFVRAILPAVALAICNGCGGGSDSGAATQESQSPTHPAPVVNNNGAPTISGEPVATAQVGVAYLFQPVASDPDGDPLKFSAENLPPWANLDGITGRITGTPQASDAGEYQAITITVADALHHAISSPFTITVTGIDSSAATGVARLAWEVPVSKVDGAPLDDLAGYHILYGRNADDLDHSEFVDGASVTTFELGALEGGLWYFAISAVSSGGLEGPRTTIATKSI